MLVFNPPMLADVFTLSINRPASFEEGKH